MQKLVIQSQFMGVKPCEIEIRKFLLLIGEQASGKSTIAKLIYFFQTLPDAIYENALLASSRGEQWFDFVQHINKVARQSFLETFGPTTRSEPFEIFFYYDERSYLRIYKGSDSLAYADFESQFGFDIGQQIIKLFNAPRLSETADEILFREQLRQRINEIFRRINRSHTFIIAGRNNIVSYPEIFEKVVTNEIEKLVEDEVKHQDFEKRQRLGNERLLLKFVEWSKGVRENFKKNGHTFRDFARTLENRTELNKVNSIARTILKGNYISDSVGERIHVDGSSLRIPLKDASSGQQEVLRILQGIFLAIGLQNRKEFLIIEEPEAHLFPLAQRELINAFALFLNTIPEGRLIITTHSPYILACVNLLLMAGYTSRQNGEVLRQKVGEAVPQGFWLNSDEFNAYALGGEEEYRLNIKDEVTGLISENYLDNISRYIGAQFHQLYDLLTQPN